MFISHLNQSAKTQKLVNHDHAPPVKSIKLSYSAGLFIHNIGGITKQVQSKRCSSGVPLTFSSCPQMSTFSSRPRNFCSHPINAVFEDHNHMGFGTADAHMEYTDCVNELNVLVDNLQPADPQSL